MTFDNVTIGLLIFYAIGGLLAIGMILIIIFSDKK